MAGDNAGHYYVLSRFLLSRMLTVTKLSDLEANLFKLMEQQGYGDEYINRYKMMTRFHHQGVSLVILVCGTTCVGKSTIATQLAQRLNLPNVLQTDMVYELLRTSTEGCTWIQVYIYISNDDENKLPRNMPTENEVKSLKVNEKEATKLEHDSVACKRDSKIICHNPSHLKSDDLKSADGLNKVSDGLESVCTVEKASENKCNNTKDSVADSKPPLRTEKSGSSEPIIIPIVLKMAEFDHKALLEECISTRTFSDKFPIQGKDKLASNLKTIQDYCHRRPLRRAYVNLFYARFSWNQKARHGRSRVTWILAGRHDHAMCDLCVHADLSWSVAGQFQF